MPHDPKRLQNRLLADQAKPVPLHVAASVIHQQLSGNARDWHDRAYDAVLDSTALALSHIADIYYVNAQARLLRVPDEELAIGMFEGGAKRLRTRSGNLYENLSMRRADIADAITILARARGVLRAASGESEKEEKRD